MFVGLQIRNLWKPLFVQRCEYKAILKLKAQSNTMEVKTTGKEQLTISNFN